MDMKIFARRLKECRKSKNISAIELGQIAGVRSATIHRYENAEFKSIKQDRLEAIANYLGVSIDYLIGNSDDKYTVNSHEAFFDDQYVEINKIVNFTTNLVKQKNVTLDGKPITETNVDYLIDAMELALEMLKKKNNK